MKFTCTKCGRTYVAHEQVSGRAFKMKCRKCGHLIVVKPEGAAAQSQAGASGITPSPAPIAFPEFDPPHGAPPADPIAAMAAELSGETAGKGEAGPPEDFLGDLNEPGPEPAHAPAPAKRSEAEEAFADLSSQLETTGERPLHVVRGDVLSKPAPTAAAAPPANQPPIAPPKRGIGMPIGIALGVLGLVAAGLFVMSGKPGQSAKAKPAAAPAAAPLKPAGGDALFPPPASASAGAVVPPAAVAAPEEEPAHGDASEPAGKPERSASDTRSKSDKKRAAKPQAKAEAKRAPPPPPPPKVAIAEAASVVRSQPAKTATAPTPGPSRPPAPPPVTSSSDRPLDDAQIEATIARNQRNLEGCLAQARKKEPHLLGETRRVMITMTVNPNGRAMYPTLDDAELGSTDLGACLKREAGKMDFPEFAGEPVRVRVPLVLR